MANSDQIAASYLKHILIAIEVDDRAAPFRDFFDNWYAFTIREGHLTKGNRPVWFNNPCAKKHGSALAAMPFISSSAAAVLEHSKTDPIRYNARRQKKDFSIRLMVDHAVPLKIMIDQLFESRFQIEHTPNSIEQFLQRWYRLGVLTAHEDDKLNKAGLKSKMPSNWDGNAEFARYDAIGIQRHVINLRKI